MASTTKKLFECLISDNLSDLKQLFKEALAPHIQEILTEDIRDQNQDRIGSVQDDNYANTISDEEYPLAEAGRWKIVKVRFRHGKIQRRKKVSTVKGYTFRGGRLKRMTAIERRHRKMGARRARYKRRAERSSIRRHMKQTLRKRRSMGYGPKKHK